MEMYIISKVISLKMKTLIFAVICTYLNLDHRKEDAFRQILFNSEEAVALSPVMKKKSNIIFVGILLYSILHIEIYRAFFSHIKEK